MAWSTLKTYKVFQIFGVPQGGSAFDATAISTLYGPFGEPYEFAALVTNFQTKITAAVADSDKVTLLETLLTRRDAIGPTSPVVINKSSGGAEGVIADHPGEREAIRRELGSILGVSAPKGGYMMERAYNSGGYGVSR